MKDNFLTSIKKVKCDILVQYKEYEGFYLIPTQLTHYCTQNIIDMMIINAQPLK